MANYAQIAQETITVNREDGTTRQWRFTFEKKDGTAQAYNIPLIEDIEIIQGDRSDAPNKPFKTHQASFRVKGVNEPLIDEIVSAGLRGIRVIIEDTSASSIKFQGFVLKDLTDYRLYDDVQEVAVNCYGALADLDGISMLFDSSLFQSFITLDELAGDIATALDLPRELDVFTSLHHQNRLASDPFPTDVSFNEQPIAGGQADASMLAVVKNVMTALGFQLFQRGGRLVMADLYDRFANSAAINKHQSDGLGGYTNTTENIEVALSESNVIRGGNFKDLAPVKALQQRYGMTRRKAAAFTDPSPVFQGRGTEAERPMDFGLAMEGDVITVNIDGQLETTGPAADVSGSVEFARMELQDYMSGKTFWFDPSGNEWIETTTGWSQNFSFTGGGGVQQQAFLVNGQELPPVPKGLLAKIILVTSCNLTITTGSENDVTETGYDALGVAADFSDPDAAATHIFEASSDEGIGEVIQGSTLLGDVDLHTDFHAFQYNNAGSRENTFNWISPTGNGRLGHVVSERAGAVVVGRGREFTVLIRDTTEVDLLTVIKITDNDDVVRTCLPVEVHHRLKSGYYRVRVREAFNGVISSSDTYGGGASTESGSTTGTSSPSAEPGMSVTEGDERYLRKSQNGADILDAIAFRNNIALGATDDVIFDNITGSGLVRGDSLRTDSGKIHAPVDFAFRNAGDTGYRKISIAQATGIDHAVAAGRTITLNPDGDGVITWDNGAQDLTGNRSWTPTIVDHAAGQRGVVSTGIQNIYGRKQFQNESQFLDDIFLDRGQVWDDVNSFLTSATFVEGFGGSGIQIEKVDGQWVGTIDGLIVRDFARFYELIVEKIQGAGGTVVINDAMKAEDIQQTASADWSWDDDTIFPWDDGQEVSPGVAFSFANNWRAFTPEDMLMEFTIDDLIKRQNYTGRGVGVTRGTVFATEDGDVEPTVNTPARWFEFWVDSGDAPLNNSDWVRLGNKTDADRQGGIFLTSTDSGAPYRRIYNGFNSWSVEGSMDIIQYQDGRLDNITDADFAELDGTQQNLYGNYTKNGFYKGKVVVAAGSTGAVNFDDLPDTAAARDDIAEVLGWADYDAMLLDALTQGDTLIQGGFLRTSLIDVQDLWSVNATITGAFVLGAGASFDSNVLNFTQNDFELIANNLTVTSNFGGLLEVGDVFMARGDTNTGNLAGAKFDTLKLWLGEISGEYSGMKSGVGSTKSFFTGADDSIGTNAKAYFRADGYLFSQGISKSEIPAPQLNASYGTNPSSVGNFTFPNNWTIRHSTTTTGTPTPTTRVVKKIKIRKNGGTTKLIIIVWAHINNSNGGHTVVTADNRIRIKGIGITDSEQLITATGFTRHVFEADFSSADLFNDGIERIIEIEVESSIEIIQADGAGTAFAETILNDDLISLEQAV